jgi:small-conductance mechanosensitive channel
MTSTSGLGGWLSQHPELLALIILVAGVAIAWLLRKLVAQLASWINRLSARSGIGTTLAISPAFTRTLQLLLFWGIVVAAAVRSAYLIGGSQGGGLLDGLWTIVMRALVALIILAAAHVVGVLARNLISGLARTQNLKMLPRLVYAVIVGVALVMALAHLGLDVTLISWVVLVTVAVFLGGLGLAFALGARTVVANLAAQGELARYRPGDRLRVDGTEGTVVEIDRTGVVLSSAEGFARVPAARFAESTVFVISEPEDDG